MILYLSCFIALYNFHFLPPPPSPIIYLNIIKFSVNEIIGTPKSNEKNISTLEWKYK